MRFKKDGTIDKRSIATHREGVRAGSTTDWLSSFKVGERRWVESPKNVGPTMRKLLPHKSRWPAEIRHMNFTCSAWTAVGGLAECRVLVCIQREADRRAEDNI